MNFKYRITNNTALANGGEGRRNIFVAVAGALIKPGGVCHALRIDQATKNLRDAKDLLIEEGNFAVGNDFSTIKPRDRDGNITDHDDAPPPPFQPPIIKDPEESMADRETRASRANVSTTGGKVPVMHDPSEPFKDRWAGEKRATPPGQTMPNDMPERVVMPSRDGTEKTASDRMTSDRTAAESQADPDKGGVTGVSATSNLDGDVPNFGGDDPSSPSGSSGSGAGSGYGSKGGKKRP